MFISTQMEADEKVIEIYISQMPINDIVHRLKSIIQPIKKGASAPLLLYNKLIYNNVVGHT
jgi:hypothetical protein